MKKIHTAEQLYDTLAEDIVWRKKELAIIRHAVETSSARPDKLQYAIRSGIALLYAHWEGFVKQASNSYLRFIATQGLRYEELAPNIIALGVKQELDLMQESSKSAVHIRVVELFLNGMSKKCPIPWEYAIRTESNLSYNVLTNILQAIGVDAREYETESKLLDEVLLNTRNHIAHGQVLFMGQSEFLTLHEEMVRLLQLFFDQVVNAAVLESYRSR